MSKMSTSTKQITAQLKRIIHTIQNINQKSPNNTTLKGFVNFSLQIELFINGRQNSFCFRSQNQFSGRCLYERFK